MAARPTELAAAGRRACPTPTPTRGCTWRSPRARAGPAAGSPRPAPAAPGYLQLVDLAPTVRHALDRPAARAGLFAGHAAPHRARPPGRTWPTRWRRLVAADREADRTSAVAGWFFAAADRGQLLLFARSCRCCVGPGGTPVRPVRRPPGCRRPRCCWSRRRWRCRRRWSPTPCPVVAAAAAGALFGAVTLAWSGGGDRPVVASPRCRRTLGPLGAVAAGTAAVVAARPAHRRATAAQRRGRLLGIQGAAGTPGWARRPGCVRRRGAAGRRLRWRSGSPAVAAGDRGGAGRRWRWSWSAARTWGRTRRRDRADRRGVRGRGDVHRRLAHLRPAGLGGAGRARGDRRRWR